jgi:hypothetical protein
MAHVPWVGDARQDLTYRYRVFSIAAYQKASTAVHEGTGGSAMSSAVARGDHEARQKMLRSSRQLAVLERGGENLVAAEAAGSTLGYESAAVLRREGILIIE